MTSTVKKGAGRPAAEQRSAKHAQRTPLPPRKGSLGAEAIAAQACEGGEEAHYAHMDANGECPWNHGDGQGHPAPEADEAARAAVAEADVTGEFRYGRMTAAQLREVAKGKGVQGYSRMAKGALLTAILEAEQAQASTAARLAERDTVADVFAVAEKSKPAQPPAPRRKKSGDRTPEPTYGEMVGAALLRGEPEVVCDGRLNATISEGKAKSIAKAEAFLKAAAELGWERVAEESQAAVYAGMENTYGVSVVRAFDGAGDERINIEWESGVFVGETCYHSHPLRSPRKVINASAAKKIMAMDWEKAAEEARKVSAHKSARPGRKSAGEATATRRKALPFDAETSTDEEILRAVAGREITWTNSISGAEQSARVTGARNRVITGRNGARAIDFNSPAGACTVRVSAIVSVR